eukprot:scaffold2033_cov367-Prasinococcus_capsulatus_cf.AAC.22
MASWSTTPHPPPPPAENELLACKPYLESGGCVLVSDVPRSHHLYAPACTLAQSSCTAIFQIPLDM